MAAASPGEFFTGTRLPHWLPPVWSFYYPEKALQPNCPKDFEALGDPLSPSGTLSRYLGTLVVITRPPTAIAFQHRPQYILETKDLNIPEFFQQGTPVHHDLPPLIFLLKIFSPDTSFGAHASAHRLRSHHFSHRRNQIIN